MLIWPDEKVKEAICWEKYEESLYVPVASASQYKELLQKRLRSLMVACCQQLALIGWYKFRQCFQLAIDRCYLIGDMWDG